MKKKAVQLCFWTAAKPAGNEKTLAVSADARVYVVKYQQYRCFPEPTQIVICVFFVLTLY